VHRGRARLVRDPAQRTLTLFLLTPAAYVWVYFTGPGVLARAALMLFALSFLAARGRGWSLPPVSVDGSKNTHESDFGKCQAGEY
jgi:hypothetical protein